MRRISALIVVAILITVAARWLWPDAAPDALALQLAYDREAAAGDKRHDAGLKVMAADCVRDTSTGYLCWIKFVSRDDSSQRLYFDAVTMARENGSWALKSGLCKS